MESHHTASFSKLRVTNRLSVKGVEVGRPLGGVGVECHCVVLYAVDHEQGRPGYPLVRCVLPLSPRSTPCHVVRQTSEHFSSRNACTVLCITCQHLPNPCLSHVVGRQILRLDDLQHIHQVVKELVRVVVLYIPTNNRHSEAVVVLW
jgi:hypothetical protein